MAQDTYRNFADRYDLFFEEFGRHSDEEAAFYRSLFAENEVVSALDCACGTGHDLVMFEALGVRVSGSDASPAMLERARLNLTKRGLDLPLATVDFRDLPGHFHEPFDAVMCLSTSLLEVGGEEEILRALRSMYGVLRDRGILVISQGTTDRQWRERPRFIPMVNRPGFSRVMVIDYLGRGARYNVLDVFHEARRNEFMVWSKDYPLVLLRDDYERLLGTVGFGEVVFYGSYKGEAYDEAGSDMLILVAKR